MQLIRRVAWLTMIVNIIHLFLMLAGVAYWVVGRYETRPLLPRRIIRRQRLVYLGFSLHTAIIVLALATMVIQQRYHEAYRISDQDAIQAANPPVLLDKEIGITSEAFFAFAAFYLRVGGPFITFFDIGAWAHIFGIDLFDDLFGNLLARWDLMVWMFP